MTCVACANPKQIEFAINLWEIFRLCRKHKQMYNRSRVRNQLE